MRVIWYIQNPKKFINKTIYNFMKYLNKKSILYGVFIIFCLISVYEYISARAHFNRIDSVLFYDNSVESEYGKIQKYEIKKWSCTLDDFGTKWLHYQLYLYGDKKSGWVWLIMEKKPDQSKFNHRIEWCLVEPPPGGFLMGVIYERRRLLLENQEAPT